MSSAETHARVGNGPGRSEDIAEHHQTWVTKLHETFMLRNVLALETQPTPYTAGREKNVTIPSDIVLRIALNE